jgi:hypothetical protein
MSTLSVMSQQDVFVSKVVPTLFHSTPEEFVRFLERDGTKFLRFYWEQAGKDEQAHGRSSALGLNYDIRLPFPHTTVVLITLPRQTSARGTVFMAAIYRPMRRGPFLGVSDATKVISLDVTQEVDGKPVTALKEWTHKLVVEPLGPGPEPRLEEFYQAVCELVKP